MPINDYINDVSMEIGKNFLPLPVIRLPEENISLQIPIYDVKFQVILVVLKISF